MLHKRNRSYILKDLPKNTYGYIPMRFVQVKSPKEIYVDDRQPVVLYIFEVNDNFVGIEKTKKNELRLWIDPCFQFQINPNLYVNEDHMLQVDKIKYFDS